MSGKYLISMWKTMRAKCSLFADSTARPRSETASGSELGIGATKKLLVEDFKLPWPPTTKVDETVRKKIDALSGAEA